MKKIITVIGLVILLIIGWIIYKSYYAGSSQTIIDAINKQHVGTVDYIIHEQSVNGGKVIFYFRHLNNNQLSFETWFIKRTWSGWKTTHYRAGISGSNINYHPTEEGIKYEPISELYLPKTRNVSLDPMIEGIVINPKITRIVVKDYKSQLERQAHIIEINNDFKIYYVFVNENQGKKFDVVGYDSNGSIIQKDTMDAAQSFSVGTSKRN